MLILHRVEANTSFAQLSHDIAIRRILDKLDIILIVSYTSSPLS
jgi:hypothetical protein